jgi:hypothetical protein
MSRRGFQAGRRSGSGSKVTEWVVSVIGWNLSGNNKLKVTAITALYGILGIG